MKYALQDKTGKETASVSFENGNIISLGGNAKVKLKLKTKLFHRKDINQILKIFLKNQTVY